MNHLEDEGESEDKTYARPNDSLNAQGYNVDEKDHKHGYLVYFHTGRRETLKAGRSNS